MNISSSANCYPLVAQAHSTPFWFEARLGPRIVLGCISKLVEKFSFIFMQKRRRVSTFFRASYEYGTWFDAIPRAVFP